MYSSVELIITPICYGEVLHFSANLMFYTFFFSSVSAFFLKIFVFLWVKPIILDYFLTITKECKSALDVWYEPENARKFKRKKNRLILEIIFDRRFVPDGRRAPTNHDIIGRMFYRDGGYGPSAHSTLLIPRLTYDSNYNYEVLRENIRTRGQLYNNLTGERIPLSEWDNTIGLVKYRDYPDLFTHASWVPGYDIPVSIDSNI